MIDIALHIRRESNFWSGVSPTSIESYMKELQEAKEKLNKFSFSYQHNLFGSQDLINMIIREIDTELQYCEFYKKYAERQRTEPTLNTWVLTKKEDIHPFREWNKPKGDRWTKTNGRIKATIEIDRSGIMTKPTLSYENDSESLEFMDRYTEHKEVEVAHLRNEDSIQHKIAEFKEHADQYMRRHMFPVYTPEKRSYETLLQLLHITPEEA